MYRVATSRVVPFQASSIAKGIAAKQCPAKIQSAFNTWAFKREQPSDAERLQAQVARAVDANRPIPFVLYWGKGPRNSAAQPDFACLDFLASMVQRIEAAYQPGAVLTLIFTDTHAELNGHAPAAYTAYFAAIEACLDQDRFRCIRLSHLVRAAGSADLPNTPPDPDQIDRLQRSAERWYRGGGSPRQGAEQYLRANAIERRAVEIAFPEAIFVTFNGAEFDFLFPAALPKFYMYSLRKGWSVKPWFMAADGSVMNAAI